MTTTLSIKNAPDDVVSKLRARAERHHRSLQGELMAIIEAAAHEERGADPFAVLERARALNLPQDEGSAAIVRAMRDGRSGR